MVFVFRWNVVFSYKRIAIVLYCRLSVRLFYVSDCFDIQAIFVRLNFFLNYFAPMDSLSFIIVIKCCYMSLKKPSPNLRIPTFCLWTNLIVPAPAILAAGQAEYVVLDVQLEPVLYLCCFYIHPLLGKSQKSYFLWPGH